MADFSLSDVTVVAQVSSTEKPGDPIDRLNAYLSLGWKLLNVGTEYHDNGDGTQWSQILYSVGWIGDPENAVEPELDTEEEPGFGVWL